MFPESGALKKILVTDGGYRSTLALVRAISDYEVHVGSATRLSCAFYSRFTKKRMLYDTSCPDSFVDSINKYVKQNSIDALLPVGDKTFLYSSLRKHELNTFVPAADFQKMSVARSKPEMMERARKLNIKTPRIVANPSCFPAVLKPKRGRGNLRFVNSEAEFDAARKSYEAQGLDFFTSEYVRGNGEHYAFMGLFRRGILQAFFMQRELRVWPVTGGSATYAVSAYDKEVKEKCAKLVGGLDWDGVASVSFKIDVHGDMQFLEVNAKFWDSLEFPIACGVNFPLLLLRTAEEQQVKQPLYPVGLSFRWVVDDTLSFLAKPSYPALSNLQDVHLDDLPAHFVYGFTRLTSIYRAKRRLKNFVFGYPYGKPN